MSTIATPEILTVALPIEDQGDRLTLREYIGEIEVDGQKIELDSGLSRMQFFLSLNGHTEIVNLKAVLDAWVPGFVERANS